MTPEAARRRAIDAVDAARKRGGIAYALGQGGMNPSFPVPWTKRGCDCTGFGAWVYGYSRHHPDFGWLNSDSIVLDAKSPGGLYTQVEHAEPGFALVYPGRRLDGRWSYGHFGVVIDAKDGRATQVAHCSSGNWSRARNALLITPPDVFERNGAIAVRFECSTNPQPDRSSP